MHKIGLIILLFTFSNGLLGQEIFGDSTFMDGGDIYGVKIYVDDFVMTHKKLYGHRFKAKKGRSLYKIRVKQVFAMKDTSLYKDSLELSKVEFLLVNNDIHHLEEGKEYYITARNSHAKDYLIATKIFNKKTSFYYYDQMAYISGLIVSYKLNIFQKIKMFFGADWEKIYPKARKRTKEENVFWQEIQKYKSMIKE